MSGRFEPAAWSWSPERAEALVRSLAEAVGFPVQPPGEAARDGRGELRLEDALGDAVAGAGLHCESVSVPPRDTWAALRRAAPVILQGQAAPGGEGSLGWLAVLRADRGGAVLLTPAGPRQVPRWALEEALWSTVGAASVAPIGLSVGSPKRAAAAARLLAAATLSGRALVEGWSVRQPAVGMRAALRAANLGRRAAVVLGTYVVQFALLIAIWNHVGARTLTGVRAGGWAPFVALLASWVAVQLGASWLVSRLALDVGAVVRGALLRGALRLERDRIRALGLGQLLGRALDAEVLDALALGGLLEAVASGFELVLGAGLLALGAAPRASLATLAAVVLALGVTARAQRRRLGAWSARRRALTHDLVERMVGHRTVLVQDRPGERRQADVAALRAYEGDTRALDRVETVLSVGIPRVWLLAGLAALGPLLLGASSSAAGSPAPIALTIGGVWLVYGALRRLGAALPALALARDAWTALRPLAGERPDEPARAAGGSPTGPPPAPVSDAVAPLVAADGVSYQYQGRPTPALARVDVRIGAGDRVLVEGASGGGKSTLAALLTGLRVPTAGQLSLRGVPQRQVGLERWRRSIAGAPQFHDNHVFSADLLFNVLMGRRWPPRLEDVQEAERVCRELGLGALLERMPAGLQQQVGETGWRLSHGERSRLFVARSLLQHLDGRVLDESFAALDPQTLEQVLAAVLARPEALIVIAHP